MDKVKSELYSAKKSYDQSDQDSIVRFAELLAEWLEFVLSPKSDLYFIARGLDKEDEIKSIIYDDKNHKQFFSFFLNVPRGRRYLMELVDRWLLQRYDLETVKKILKTLDKVEKKEESFKLRNTFTIDMITAIILILILVSSISLNQFKCIFDSIFKFGLLTIYASSIILFTYLYKKPAMSKRFIPRLFIAIIIGYIPLLFGEEMWKLGYYADYKTIAAIFIFCLGAAYLYLRFEVGNKILDKSKIFIRTWKIFSRGIAYSLIIGFIIQDITCRYMLVSSGQENFILFDGLLGAISPKILLVFFPLALLIGIFVQIIWEDKPITHPL